jgi:hypothetical protein
LGIGLLQLNCILFALYGFNRSCCLVTLRIEAKPRIGELPFYLGQRVVDTGAYASNDAHCRVGAGGVVFDQKAAPCLRHLLDSSSHGPKRLAQVSNWIIDLLLKHGCLLSLGNWLHCGLAHVMQHHAPFEWDRAQMRRQQREIVRRQCSPKND